MADDALQLVGVGGEALFDGVEVVVVFVVEHPDGGGIVLVFNEKESAGVHVGDLVHEVDGFLVVEVVVELVVQGDGLTFLC